MGSPVTCSGSNPIACAKAYVSGERNYPTAQIPAAYNGTPCAERAFGFAGLLGRTILDRHTAKQPSHALRRHQMSAMSHAAASSVITMMIVRP